MQCPGILPVIVQVYINSIALADGERQFHRMLEDTFLTGYRNVRFPNSLSAYGNCHMGGGRSVVVEVAMTQCQFQNSPGFQIEQALPFFAKII